MGLLDTVNQVIRLAEASQDYWATELPKRHRDYPIVHEGEDSGPPPPEEAKLQALVKSLPADTIYKLALIMQIGREDIGTDNLAESYRALKRTLGKPERAASRLLAKSSLADYLADGLAELKKHSIDPEALFGQPAVTSK